MLAARRSAGASADEPEPLGPGPSGARGDRHGIATCRALAWATGLSVVLVALNLPGHGSLSQPPLLAPGRIGPWLHSHTVITAALGTLRVIATILGGYLLATTMAGAAVRLLGWARAAAALDRVSPRIVRDVLLVTGASLLGAQAVSPPSWAGPRVETSTGSGGVVIAPPPAGQQSPSGWVMRRTSDERPRTSQPGSFRPRPASAPSGTAGGPQQAAPPAGAPPPAAPAPLWVTRPGDSLWSIAAATLEARLGRLPSDEEIEPYWSLLVDSNRSRLEDPSDPDLIFAGQAFLLPPLED